MTNRKEIRVHGNEDIMEALKNTVMISEVIPANSLEKITESIMTDTMEDFERGEEEADVTGDWLNFRANYVGMDVETFRKIPTHVQDKLIDGEMAKWVYSTQTWSVADWLGQFSDYLDHVDGDFEDAPESVRLYNSYVKHAWEAIEAFENANPTITIDF